MTTNRKELVLQGDIDRAAAAVQEALAAGGTERAERALAVYAPKTMAAIAQSTFYEVLRQHESAEQEAGKRSKITPGGRSPAEVHADALHAASRAAERVIDLMPAVDAPAAVRELPAPVLGALLSGAAAAGVEISSVAHLLSPDRVEEVLASDIDLWTTTQETASYDEGRAFGRVAGLNLQHLVHVLLVVFQTDDARARTYLRRLNPDLVAYPFAVALQERRARRGLAVPDEMSTEELVVLEESDEEASGGFFGHLAEQDERDALVAIEDAELRELLDRILALSRGTYRRILRRAYRLPTARVRAQLEHAARELVLGEEADATQGADAGGDDEMFRPLTPTERTGRSGD
ncbi:hypothetical protein HYV74_01795 [Candidatus Uhrbacteria bacterium]|nr:hypothetical protein [Candidatus Uhrbacteria bacterium]